MNDQFVLLLNKSYLNSGKPHNSGQFMADQTFHYIKSTLDLHRYKWQTDKLVYTANIYSPAIVILLCKSIKVMGKIYNLMIGQFFYKNYHWNPVIGKLLSKLAKGKVQC